MIEQIAEICEEFRIVTLNRQIKIVQKLLKSNKIIDIAILGQFKSGKSSFINSLVERTLLPTGVIPVTSVITRISYSENEYAEVIFESGSKKKIQLVEISQYIDESCNPENKKKVELVDIFLPSLKKYRGIRLVDTPGMGSYFKHNTETTMDWSPEAGISILDISAERPLSENEITLLKDLMNYSPKIIILLTKTDIFSDKQINEIKGYIRESLQKEFDIDFTLFEYSIHRETETYRSIIEKVLIEPLVTNIDTEFQKIIEHKIKNLIKETVNYLDIAYQASLKAESERERIKIKIIDEKLNYDFIFKEVRLISNSYTGQTRESLVNKLEKFKLDLIKKLNNEYKSSSSDWRGNLWKLTRIFEEWSKNILQSELFSISDSYHYEFIENLKTAKNHFTHFLRDFRERLTQNISTVLGISLKLEEWEIPIGEIKQPDIRIGRSFDFHLDLIWFLFPMFIFRNIFVNHFRKQILTLIETNLYRMASDYTARINKEIINIERFTINQIKDELDTIGNVILSKDNNSSMILEKINALLEMIKKSTQNN
ncbi:MAG: hypothetical protein A2X61_13915 [Ignavibacteria bacterium GWB2_35_12]|nr:MAG: hypothetical protein A2X61_13915 [Ignavibacteria bacterium GWB2_35_12]OGU86786.1 MAG: hypothetical protein A2220_08955 [Ignavibacteria bacterium RIFOXYA2_FULL_35_10]OGV23130.1 MAG: hypothetical protein A2475_17245 [Ignavibacteria bacterium RIFOXYC2_FULL_35_21]